MTVERIAARAKGASRTLAVAPAAERDGALLAIAAALDAHAAAILAANAEDVAAAEGDVAGGRMTRALLDRLRLDAAKLAGMAHQVRAVAALPDPIGRVLARTRLDEGLELHKVACPLGLLAAFLEARPDAVTQIAALALKSGNAVVLKPGHEAERTTRALLAAIHSALRGRATTPADAVAMVEGRAAVDTLLGLEGTVDLVIPRGSNALVRAVQARTRIPVLGHADGICHVYIDAAADARMAVDIVVDAKVQYPAACNAVETVLLHTDAAPRILAPLLDRLAGHGVEVRACERTRALARGRSLTPASDDDWSTEYGALIVALKLVGCLEDAVEHINRYGSHHTDTIVTGDPRAAAYFLGRVDSAGVFHNASTRFSDGYRYGLGAEVGISTGKLHARGPVGLVGLTTYKYLLHGSGQTVAAYTGPNARPFRHEALD
ncbi:MAG: glutamate-5-semialdehyde dehydrogenase [Gemmatimonadaceae bacterium]|nr:glutamate-5-semialdehyde dehydrogenase [Gemmatimonadaceae bacterium]